MGQESRWGLAGSPAAASHKPAGKVFSRAAVSSEARLGKDPFQSYPGFEQNLVLCMLSTQGLGFLLAVGWKQPLVLCHVNLPHTAASFCKANEGVRLLTRQVPVSRHVTGHGTAHSPSPL